MIHVRVPADAPELAPRAACVLLALLRDDAPGRGNRLPVVEGIASTSRHAGARSLATSSHDGVTPAGEEGSA
ncbi:MAG TPA: hypothetical protein VN636_18265 [Acidimicrobiia bacterium]|nr:hypothetical protein [Acidimicrobiia bacterium]